MARRRAQRRAGHRLPGDASATGCSVGVGRRRLGPGPGVGGRGAGGAGPVAAARTTSGWMSSGAGSARAAAASGSRACGTGRGSCPAAVDDSVRIFSNDFPATGALHPLASAGPDVVSLRATGGLTVTPAARRRAPAATGRGHAAAGRARADRRADVDRLGDRRGRPPHLPLRRHGALGPAEDGPRGPDSAKARRLNSLANRIVSIDADLEYGLQEGRFWMPYRQVIAGRVRLPVVNDLVIPFQATTTFDDYEINAGRPDRVRRAAPRHGGSEPRLAQGAASRSAGLAAGRAPGGRGDVGDSLRSWNYADRWPGGRYELHRPVQRDRSTATTSGPIRCRSTPIRPMPAGSREAEADLARLSETLPDSTHRQQARRAWAYERLADAAALRPGAGSLVRAGVSGSGAGCGSPRCTGRCATA